VDSSTAIRVYRVEYRDTQYEEDIPYQTEYKESSLVWRFKKRQYVIREGSQGKNLVTYRERYVDGELESSLVTKVETIRQPVNELVLKYKANEPISPLEAPDGITLKNNVPSSYKTCYTMSATGYSAKKGRGASRLGLYYGTVAVNPNLIPYGTKLYITSADGQFIYGFAIATDTGTAMMANPMAIDLFYETYKESSLNWKNNVNIYILE
jgi:3D (Asp-Asp-Asp) domain-containing protein